MAGKPKLIIFSQNLLGGGASFHRNMISHFPKDFFEITCIYLDPKEGNGTRSLDLNLSATDRVFSFGNEANNLIAKRLSALFPSGEGVVVANLETELISLDLYRKPTFTVYFICHDDGFIELAVKYESIIDVFIAHNNAVYEELVKRLKGRENEIYFIQHGVNISPVDRIFNYSKKLNIVFLARHYEFKGIYDLPIIDDILRERKVNVEWKILGDGPERNNFIDSVAHKNNFSFEIPLTSPEVIDILKTQDIFILPSRKDGLPVALLEAMSVGCVPLLSNFSDGIKKVVTSDIGFVLPVGDCEAFAEKIVMLNESRILLQTLGMNCVEKSKSDFDIKKQAMKYYNLYQSFIKIKKKRVVTFSDLLRLAGYFPTISKFFFLIKKLKKNIL